MKKLLTICSIIISAVLFSSCLSQQSLTNNLNSNQTTVILSQANYKIIGVVRGEAIGSTANKLVVNNAYADMVNNANLTDNQALININYERITRLSKKQHVVVTATVIEFVK